MRPSDEQQLAAIKTLREAGYFGISWTVEDIISQAADNMGIELSEDDAFVIAEQIDDTFDATLGITWDTIETYVNEYMETNEEK